MPEPLKTWIALDFEAFATQIACVKRDKSGKSAIKTARFYNLFETNAISRRATPRVELDDARELAKAAPGRSVSLTLDEWLSDEPTISEGEPYGAENLLVELMAELKDKCEEILDKNVSDCVLTLPKRGELYERIRRAAIGAGFGYVMHRDRGICAAHNWAVAERPKAKRLLLCRVGYDATEIYVFKPRDCGVEDSSEHVRYEWNKLGLFQVLKKAAERVVESVEKKIGAEKAREWRAQTPALLVEIDVKLREYLADPTPERAKKLEIVRVGNLKLNLPNTILATSLAKNNAKIANGVRDVVAKLTKHGRLAADDFEILVSGDGATEALADEIRKHCPNVSLDASGESPAQGCVSFLKSLPLPYDARTEDERDYAALYARAARGEVAAYFPLALAYLTGKGTTKRYEEGVFWLKEADKRDVPEASEYLAQCYDKGRGTAKNPKKASEARERARRLRGAKSGGRSGSYAFEWTDNSDSNSGFDPASDSRSGSRSGSGSGASPTPPPPLFEQSRSGSPPRSEASSTTPTQPRSGKTTRFATPARVKEKIWGEAISGFLFFIKGAKIAANHADDPIPLGIGLTLLLTGVVFALVAVATYYRKRERANVGVDGKEGDLAK